MAIEPRAGAKLSAKEGRVRNAEMLWLLAVALSANGMATGAGQRQKLEEHVAQRLKLSTDAKHVRNELIEVPRWLSCKHSKC